jgi:HD-like signal output (HDOD) protein
MQIDMTAEQAQATLKGITIPPRPTILMELGSLLKREGVDVRLVADRVARDVALSSAVLKTVNSPMFALKSKCASVQQAVQLLGMKSIFSLVTALALRNFAAGGGVSLERFWDSAEKVAGLAAFIAGTLPRVSREEAYTFGLFRDAGIPVLLLRWPEYGATLKASAGARCLITTVEDERHGTNHAVVGYLLARSWALPAHLCQAIQRHHDLSVYEAGDSVSGGALTLIAVNRLAENLHDTALRLRNDEEWDEVGDRVLNYLGIADGEYSDLREEVAGMKF